MDYIGVDDVCHYADDQNGRIIGTNDTNLPPVDVRQLEIVK